MRRPIDEREVRARDVGPRARCGSRRRCRTRRAAASVETRAETWSFVIAPCARNVRPPTSAIVRTMPWRRAGDAPAPSHQRARVPSSARSISIVASPASPNGTVAPDRVGARGLRKSARERDHDVDGATIAERAVGRRPPSAAAVVPSSQSASRDALRRCGPRRRLGRALGGSLVSTTAARAVSRCTRRRRTFRRKRRARAAASGACSAPGAARQPNARPARRAVQRERPETNAARPSERQRAGEERSLTM